MSFDLELLDSRAQEDEERDYGRKIYGVVTGTVINVLDPLQLGRLQVRIPIIDSLDVSPWARVATFMAGLLHGSYFIPNVGDEVLIAFENGDVRVPYILGSIWNSLSRPPLPSPLPQTRVIRTLAGNQIVFEELPPTITIQNGAVSPVPIPAPALPTGPCQTISVAPNGVQVSAATILLQSGASTISVTPSAIVLTVGASVITLNADGIKIVAGKEVKVAGAQSVQILGAEVRINS